MARVEYRLDAAEALPEALNEALNEPLQRVAGYTRRRLEAVPIDGGGSRQQFPMRPLSRLFDRDGADVVFRNSHATSAPSSSASSGRSRPGVDGVGP